MVRKRVHKEYDEAYSGSDIMRCFRDIWCCWPRQPKRYFLSFSTLQIKHREFVRCCGFRCGGCLGYVNHCDNVHLDKIHDVDTSVTASGCGCFQYQRCEIQ